jgi:glycosyltransferase involved in cell wall biosynthesis
MARVAGASSKSEEKPVKNRICLAMIVKNEAPVIRRCLESVRPLLSAWIVVDTGSTDGTQALVRETMTGLPGVLAERPWRDFSANRNEAVAFAESTGSEFVLVIDADDVLVMPDSFKMPELTADAYQLRIDYGDISYHRTQLFRACKGFRYEGILHEVIADPPGAIVERLDGLSIKVVGDGARARDPEKYKKDATVLEAELAKDPSDARTAFYLAQSYRDAGMLREARTAYEARAKLSGWDEETWYSILQIAHLSGLLGYARDDVIDRYLGAFAIRPQRAEPLCYAAILLRERGDVVRAYPFARAAVDIPFSEHDRLFVDTSVYRWRALDELGVSAYWAGRYDEGHSACRKLLRGNALPEEHRPRVVQNMKFHAEKLKT